MSSAHVIASFWEEHCLECAMPACYGACRMFERGWHGRCIRVDGFEESICGTGKIMFRKWGKIEMMYHGRMISGRTARMIEKMNIVLRPLWHLLGMRHRAVRWRILAALGCDEHPTIWRLRMKSERDECLAASIAYEDGREVWRKPIMLKAGVDYTIEWRLPRVEKGSLFRIFPLNGEATGEIEIQENTIANMQCLTTINTKPTQLKCIAWDLDGVVWDGTLSEGEDVKLRSSVMDTIKALDAVGIVSSLCSKNDPNVALAKLKDLGIEEWFVFPQISWKPKSESLKNLANEMNIGLDAIAFVDDREENRAEVRENCQGVRVCDEKSYFDFCRKEVERCRSEGVIGGLGPQRRKLYRGEMLRRGAARRFEGDDTAFAKASELMFELLPVTGDRVGRCRELVQRTNQLNITARRYDETAFAELLRKNNCVAVRVWDKYGDYGIVGFLARRGARLVECCFSCRSAGRGIERRVIAEIACGGKLTADIIETDRNLPIREIIKEFL